MDGFLYNRALTVFRATVDAHLLLVSLAWAFVIALCGTVPLAAGWSGNPKYTRCGTSDQGNMT
jgi:hypothetical protein